MGFIADIFTADRAADAQRDASRDQIAASQDATRQTLALQREIFQTIWNGSSIPREAGNQATAMLARSFGIDLSAQAPAQQPGQPNQPPSPPPAPSNPGNPFGPGSGGTGGGAMREHSIRPGGAGRMPHVDGGDGGPMNRPTTGGGTRPPPLPPGVLPGVRPGVQANSGGGAPQTGGTHPPGTLPQPNGPQTGGPLPPATGGGAGQGGGNAINPYGDFIASPDYQYRLEQGLRGGRNALSHIGQLGSGAAVRALGDYQGNMALGEFNNWRSGLGALAGIGAGAFNTGANAGANYANQSGNALQRNAQNLGSSYQNRGDAMSGFWGSVGGSLNNAGNMFAQLMGGF